MSTTSIAKVPSGPHFAIITEEQDSEGYGHINYEAFEKREDWENKIQQLSLSKFHSKPFRALVITPAKINVTVEINV